MRLSRAPWYVEFFGDDYLEAYRDVLTPERTKREVEFVQKALELEPGAHVLDLCCGEGRHALLLASRGLVVTAQDLSDVYLKTAQEAADEQGVSIELVTGDMREIPFTDRFDAVINMFTAFGYLESDEEDAKVLHSAANALKPGGKLLLDTINREWVVAHNIPAEWRIEDDGTAYLESRELDLETSLNHVSFTLIDPDGVRRSSVGHHVRLYTLTEMIRMLEAAGLTYERAYGDFDGGEYERESQRMIVVGRKGEPG